MSRKTLFTLLFGAALAACGESTTTPDPSCVVSAVTIQGAPTELAVGGTAQLNANVTSSNCSTAPTVTWASSADGTAMVSPAGLVTAVAAGPVTITATSGGKSGSANITITEPTAPVASVEIAPGDAILGVGATFRFSATGLDAGSNPLPGREVTWSSSDDDVATVEEDGTVQALQAGETATITATIEGISATVEITVVRTRIGYFWNHSADAAGMVTPDEEYSFNSVGAANLRERTGVGSYIADFGAGMSRNAPETEAIFVSTYDPPSTAAYCHQSSWTFQSLHLFCRDQSGDLLDSRWTAVHVSSGSFRGKWGFGWIPSGTESVPASSGYSYSGTQGAITSERLGVGHYEVTFEGLGRNGLPGAEGVFVNSYGGSGTCQPGAWDAGGDDLVVEVWCFKANGSPDDVAYTILVLDQPRMGAGLAYALADQPGAATYTPTRAAVRPAGSVLITRQGTGNYSVALTGFNRSNGLKETFLVTAVGSEAGRCVVGDDGWGYGSTAGSASTVHVTCWTTNGALADMPFSVLAIQ